MASSNNNLFSPPKTITLTLVGIDGNAFALMGAFQSQAKKEGWSKDEIKIVLDECMSGDYNNLLCVLDAHIESSVEYLPWSDEDWMIVEDGYGAAPENDLT